MAMGKEKNLWTFACSLYGYADVKQQCLQLQECYAADVDVILWLCWLAAGNVALTPAALPQAQQMVEPINHNLLRPLRQLRGAAVLAAALTETEKPLVRERLLSAELAMEQLVLQRLEQLTPQLPAATQGGQSLTLLTYLSTLHGFAPGQAHAAGQRLLTSLSDYLA